MQKDIGGSEKAVCQPGYQISDSVKYVDMYILQMLFS